MNLIQKLDNAFSVTQDPDTLVKHLNNNGWIRGRDITQEQFAELYLHRIWVCHRNSALEWRNDGDFTASWDRHWWLNNYHDYWLIPASLYREGVYPNVAD